MSEPLGYFEVSDWARLQHYKDRRPTWIKVHNEYQDDYAFASLPDPVKAHLIGIQLLASRIGNRIPWDVLWLAAKIHATHPLDLDLLLNRGFIKRISGVPIPEQDAPDLFRTGSGLASLETETETETEGETEQESSRALTRLEPVAIWIPVVGVKPADEKNPLLARQDLPKEKQAWHMGVLDAELVEWAKAYPGVDIGAALLRARAWSIDNPGRRKTPRGVSKFLSTWLAREQDNGRQGASGRNAAVAGGNSAPGRVRRATASRSGEGGGSGRGGEDT